MNSSQAWRNPPSQSPADSRQPSTNEGLRKLSRIARPAPLRIRIARCGRRPSLLPHHTLHLFHRHCSRLRQRALHDRPQSCPPSPPLNRRRGSHPPGPPATIPLRLCPWFLRSGPPARALVLTRYFDPFSLLASDGSQPAAKGDQRRRRSPGSDQRAIHHNDRVLLDAAYAAKCFYTARA